MNDVPVSTSVTFTLYSRIMPLMCDKGGGDQFKIIALELKLVPFRF